MAVWAKEQLACFKPFANDHEGLRSGGDYNAQPATTLAACRVSIDAVRQVFVDNAADWRSRTSPHEYDIAEHSARLLQMNEHYERDGAVRDLYMAENVTWILDRAGPRAPP